MSQLNWLPECYSVLKYINLRRCFIESKGKYCYVLDFLYIWECYDWSITLFDHWSGKPLLGPHALWQSSIRLSANLYCVLVNSPKATGYYLLPIHKLPIKRNGIWFLSIRHLVVAIPSFQGLQISRQVFFHVSNICHLLRKRIADIDGDDFPICFPFV